MNRKVYVVFVLLLLYVFVLSTTVRAASQVELTPTLGEPGDSVHFEGSDPELYEEYALAVRREYSFVPEADYRKGRYKVLQAFINRPQIYYTDIMRTRLEELARKNIKWELNRIS